MIRILEPNLTGNEAAYLQACIEENWISSQGRFVDAFEQEMLRGLTDRHALAVSNGTVAIHLALTALGVGSGDEVIVPDITFGATVNAVLQSGATPVFADVCPKHWNVDLKRVKSLVTPRTRAVIPVALFGSPCGIKEINQWAVGEDLKVIVDAAEAVGASIDGLDIGGYGDAVTYSFFGNKTLTTGEGGGVIFQDEVTADKARILRDHGMTPGRRYHHELVGFNYRMTNLQAAIGVAQYERLEFFAQRRREVVSCYRHHLRSLNSCFFQNTEGSTPSNWIVALQFDSHIQRAKVEAALSAADVETRRCFEPMHLQPAFEPYADSIQHLPVSKNLYDTVLLLPTHVNLSEQQILSICTTIADAVDHD